MRRIIEPKNNPIEVKQFLLKLELNNHKANAAECLRIVDFYQREFGYLNVKWDPNKQLTYMYEKLKHKYDNQILCEDNRQYSIQETSLD